MPHTKSLFDDPTVDSRQRLDEVVRMMKELSGQTDPQEMVRSYGKRLNAMMPTDRSVSLSRRGLEWPQVRVTRFSEWPEPINPWAERDRLPIVEGGLFADLIHSDEPTIINDLRVDPDDPAAPYLEGMRSLMALPNFDQGKALNMVLALKADPDAFDPETLPERVWMSNLFGLATHSLVIRKELERAYEHIDRELKVVAEIQRSLLPKRLPESPRLGLGAYYRTSQWAGGDSYDAFELPDGKWGLFIADSSGHGTPAAVMMAITHAISHSYPGSPEPPARFLEHLNHRLASHYTTENGAFVTAFYGIFNPEERTLRYANAGHNPPRVKPCAGHRAIRMLDAVGGLPLGVFGDARYEEATAELDPGDQIVLYTDGIIDARNPDGRMFGTERLDRALTGCRADADRIIQAVLESLETFTQGTPPDDDQTLLIAKVR